MINTAITFGQSLDKDNFKLTKTTLSPECTYNTGKEILKGPDDICHSYESNMLDGRKKIDKLEWGQSGVEQISGSDFLVHFTDYLTHKGIEHTYRCSQKLTLDADGKIVYIEHLEDLAERANLDEFYRQVGLKT